VNLHTAFDLGEDVTIKWDTKKRIRMITAIQIYLDGGFQYKTITVSEEGCPEEVWVFEREIDEKDD